MKSGFVALAGRPNAGKSTLLNALINEKLAIVSDKPETTRNQIRGVLNLPDAQIVFTDTPGLHPGAHLLQDRMNKEAQNVILGVDVIYLLVDGTRPFGSADEQVLETVTNVGVPVFLILNKVDRLPKEKVLKNLNSWQKRYEFAEYFPISALQQKDFHDLIETTLKYLPEGEMMFPKDMTSDEPIDFRIAEIIREKILYCTEEEVPHATAVQVEERKEKDGIIEIRAVILAEKDGQKAILIGRGGKMIGKIRGLAEKEISELLGKKTELDLFVKVESEWRDKDSRITACGYGNIDQ